MTFNNMSVIVLLLARNQTAPVHEVLGGLSVEQIGSIQTAIATHTTVGTRYKAIAKALMSETIESIDYCSEQLRDCDKLLNDGVTLLLNSQYGLNGVMSWEQLSGDLARIAAEKATLLGAAAGAAAGAARARAAPEDADILG